MTTVEDGASSEIACWLDADRRPWATREIDGLHWPGSYAAAVAARYLRRYGAAGAMSRRAVCDHIAAVHGWG